jgi:hypothetical protein
MIKRFIVLLLLIIPVLSFSQNIDINILRKIYSSEDQHSDKFFKFISSSHTGVEILVPLSMGIEGLINDNRNMFENACVITVASAVNMGSTFVLKHAVDRKRPYEIYTDIIPKTNEDGSSFPSNHTSAAFATATSLSLAYPKWYVIAPSYLWAGTVGYSRLHLGVHYPSDVLGGMVVGAGSAWLTYKANKWLKSKRPDKTW